MSTDGKTQMKVSRTAKNDGSGTRTHSVSDGMGASLFEVSPEDVASLAPVDLWELVARLCQVTLADAGLPTVCVTHGGHVSAPDGGIDVRVQLREGDLPPPKLPLRLATIGFQVKATKMGVGEIQSEMLKGGKLRPSIEKLIEEGGGYIIATSDSAPDEEYNKRLKKMQDCVAGVLKSGPEVHVAYCDRKVLAAWVNDYPSVVPWVRLKTKGSVLNGWEPYGQWAGSKRISDREYPPFLPDKKARFIDLCNPGRALNLIDGVERVRDVLREGGKSVRLVGLSGVGKTRFVQALFETDVGSRALDKELVVYADVGRGPSPSPTFVLDKLISEKKKTILVIDNCAPSLHRELVGRLEGAGSGEKVSLLTVEYDIREDIPYETRVFRLEGGSVELIEGIVRAQFPDISQVDVNTIARFSEGNSRIAVALASSVEQKDSLADLSDAELLDRLLLQRNDSNEEIRRVAEACSLVYSFNGEDVHGELERLAALAVVSPNLLYRHVVTLESRGLVQRRDVWRAVLPPAISNRLAADALRFIPYASIKEQIEEAIPESGDPARLLRSFSRRLGYLNESEEARVIVNGWLLSGGMLDQVRESGGVSFYMELLANVAPVNPEGAVYFIERFMKIGQVRSAIESVSDSGALCMTGSDLNDARLRLLLLLRSLAYDPILFDRCLDIIMVFASAEKSAPGFARRVIGSLFLIEFSGTHAKTDQRLEWLERKLRSDDESVRSIACRCLWKALKSRAFRSEYNFDFGARKRDFGWKPTDEEKEDWYVRFIDLSVKAVEESLLVALGIKDVLAGRFRDLWAVAIKAGGVKDSLLRAVRSFAESGCEDGWKEGWVAIRVTIFFDGKEMEEEDRNALNELEEVARPKSLLSQLWVLVFGDHFGVAFSDAEDPSDQQKAMDSMAERMGEEFAESEVLLPEAARLVTGVREGRWPSNTCVFGRSLAIHISSIRKGWEIFLEVFEPRPESERNAAVLGGYLEGVYVRDFALFNRLMDEAVERKSLVRYIPFFQSCVPLDNVGRDRLLKVMGYPEIAVKDFECLAYSPSYRTSDDKDVAIIMEGLLGMDGAPFVVARILSYYISECEKSCDPCFLNVAYEVLEAALVSWVSGANLSVDGGIDFDVKRVVEFLFGYGVEKGLAEEKTRYILQRLVEKARVGRLWPVLQLKEAMKAIFRVQPVAALDILVGDDDSHEARFRRTSLDREGEGCPLLDVPEAVLNRWCRAGGEHRWIYVASVVPAIVPAAGVGMNENEWKWSPQAASLLRNAPNQVDVAETLVNRISKWSWVGSGAEAISKRMPLLDQLADMLATEHDADIERWRGRLLGIRRSREKGEADYLAMQGFE